MVREKKPVDFAYLSCRLPLFVIISPIKKYFSESNWDKIVNNTVI